MATKFMGLVPDDYFRYHGFGDNPGLTFLFGSSLVAVNTFTTAAHELGHQFGLHRAIEEYRFADPGNSAPGFWVNGNKSFLAGSSSCFMGRESTGDPLQTGERWIDGGDYTALMNAMIEGQDPESLLVTGFLKADGSVDLKSSYFLPNAVLSVPDPDGDYVIRVRDGFGTVLSELTASMPLIQILEPIGAQPAPAVPFAFTVAYPPNSAAVEIGKAGGKVLVRFAPATKLLLDALRSAPDQAFGAVPEEGRKALLNKVQALGQMISEGHTLEAAHKLEHDIKPRIEEWLQPTATTPLQVSKEELLDLVDELSERLIAGGS
jgi:hypothetical protein